MYSTEQRRTAIGTFIEFDRSHADTIADPRYPARRPPRGRRWECKAAGEIPIAKTVRGRGSPRGGSGRRSSIASTTVFDSFISQERGWYRFSVPTSLRLQGLGFACMPRGPSSPASAWSSSCCTALYSHRSSARVRPGRRLPSPFRRTSRSSRCRRSPPCGSCRESGPSRTSGGRLPASSQIDIRPGRRQWHPQSLRMTGRALSPGPVSLMAASSIELAIPALGETEAVRLTVEPSKQSGTGVAQRRPAGVENRVTSVGRRKWGSPACIR